MPQLQPGMARIRVKDLCLRTFIGINEDEILNKQDVLINLTILYAAQDAVRDNDIDHALNYRTITKAIIAHVEGNRFALLIHDDSRAEMLQHEAQRAHGRMIGGKLMMVEVVALRGVLTADIDDGDGGIGEILCGGFAADDGHAMYGGEEAAGEEFVFVGAAGMGEDEVQRHGGLERSAGGLEVKG